MEAKIQTAPQSQKPSVGRLFYWLIVALAVVLLAVLAFTALYRQEISAFLQSLKDTPVPAWLAFMETASYPITYLVWGLLGLGVLFLAWLRVRSADWYDWWGKLARFGLVDSAAPQDVRHGLRLGAEMAGVAAFTWIVLSPVPIVPGAIHLRTFAFVPGVAALLFGRGAGFLAGYFGSIIWAILAGYWILPHTPVVDGVFVGALTGWVIAVALRGKRTREELLAQIESNRVAWIIKCALVNLIGGLVMAFFVGASLKVTTGGAVPWWVGFFTIGVLSDTVPMVVWTAFLTEPLLRLTRRYTELPNF
jgi:uncharacterized membrane protein